MAPSTLIFAHYPGHSSASSASRKTVVNAAATNTLNPLDASFGGPAVTAAHEDTTIGPLLLDPTDASATTTNVRTSATQTFSFSLISSTPSSEAAIPSSLSVHGRPSISQATLIGVTVVVSAVAFTALFLLYYLYWRKRRTTKTEPPASMEKERRRVTWTLRGIITEREARDPFADIHRPPPTLPRGSHDGSSKIIHCATDAGSVYILDGESIYGDNGASIRGVLPPAYDDLPRKTLLRGGHSISSQQQYSDSSSDEHALERTMQN